MTAYEVALEELGIHETPGPAATARITEYLASTSLKGTGMAKTDETPWCSAFVNFCCEQAGIKGTGSAAAKSWLKWGQHAVDEKPGCIVVIQQKHKGADAATNSTTGFHVGFFVGRPDQDHIRLLGGNQGDSVKYSNFPLAGYSVRDLREPLQTVSPPAQIT